ncbi:MAG: response regulator [Gammaproteobacteria bacterium]|nr:response regulator [Gammaproteobacteria bacterium]
MQGLTDVFVVESDPGLLESLLRLLRMEGLRVRGFTSGKELMRSIRPDSTGCLLMDVSNGADPSDISGLLLQQQLKQLAIPLAIVFLTNNGDVGTAAKAFRNGAVDYLQRPTERETLVKRVREALGRSLTEGHALQQRNELKRRRESLSRRELEVMQLVVAGHSSKQIARVLNISHRTVESHRIRVMRKMQADNLAELVQMDVQLNESAPALNVRPTTELNGYQARVGSLSLCSA